MESMILQELDYTRSLVHLSTDTLKKGEGPITENMINSNKGCILQMEEFDINIGMIIQGMSVQPDNITRQIKPKNNIRRTEGLL